MLNIPIFSPYLIQDLEVIILNYTPQVRLDIRKYFFSVRVIDEWNSLPVDIINCNTIHTFKKKIDYYIKNRGYYISFIELLSP